MHRHTGYPEQYLKSLSAPKMVMSPKFDAKVKDLSIHHLNVMNTFKDIHVFNYNHNMDDNVIYMHIGLRGDDVDEINRIHLFLPQYIEKLGILDVTYELLLINTDDVDPKYGITKSADRIKYEIDKLTGESVDRDKYATLLTVRYRDLSSFEKHIDIIDKLQ